MCEESKFCVYCDFHLSSPSSDEMRTRVHNPRFPFPLYSINIPIPLDLLIPLFELLSLYYANIHNDFMFKTWRQD